MSNRIANCWQHSVIPGVFSLFAFIFIGCGGVEDQRGVRVAGEGFVTIDGAPLDMGRIILITDQGNGEVKASAMIQDGAYSFTEESGPLEGQARVEIYPVEMELEDFETQRGGDPKKKVDFTRTDVPARYNVKSDLSATISAEDGIAPLFFELTTK